MIKKTTLTKPHKEDMVHLILEDESRWQELEAVDRNTSTVRRGEQWIHLWVLSCLYPRYAAPDPAPREWRYPHCSMSSRWAQKLLFYLILDSLMLTLTLSRIPSFCPKGNSVRRRIFYFVSPLFGLSTTLCEQIFKIIFTEGNIHPCLLWCTACWLGSFFCFL